MNQSITDGEVLFGNDSSIVNLTAHRINPAHHYHDGPPNPTWITIGQFKQVLDAIVDRADVHLTLDDGFASDVEIALPLLLERGLTAEFFVLAGRLGEPGRLDHEGVRQLVSSGMSIGSHGWMHRDWRRLDERQASQELGDARQVLAEITGQPVDAVAVPFGSYDRTVLRRLRQARITRVYTSDGGRARRDSWLQPRTSLRYDLDLAWITRVLDSTPSGKQRLRTAAARLVKRLR
ncbi:MAG: polysaccharide deacetylase family protein [Micromonosporaceae bacterium]|nr:polysaccharide deacetylase family protein [Micromonosporaceae bacterium]